MPTDDKDDTQSTPSLLHDGSQGEMYPVIEILAEKGSKYRVRWEGTDPATMKPWAPSWVPKKDASEALVEDWEERKVRKLQRRRRSKSSSSKSAKRAPGGHNSTTSNSKGLSTLSSSLQVSKPESVLSTSSTSSTKPAVRLKNRKRHASSDDDTTSYVAAIPSGPRKRRKLEALLIESSQGISSDESSKARNLRGAIPGHEDEDNGISQIVSNTLVSRSTSKVKEEEEILSGDDALATENDSSVAASSKTIHTIDSHSSKTNPNKSWRKRDNGKPTQLAPDLGFHSQEESEMIQKATASSKQLIPPSKTSDMPPTPHFDLSRMKPRSSRHTAQKTADIRAPIEDISIEQRVHDSVAGLDFDLHDEGLNLSQDMLAVNETLQLSVSLHQGLDTDKPESPSFPRLHNTRHNQPGSSIKSRMKGNRSLPGFLSSPTRARDSEEELRSSRTNHEVDESQDDAKFKRTKPLYPLPVITPSKFAPHLPQHEAPMSSIEEFTPDKTRSSKGKNVSAETDDIVEEGDSFAVHVLKQRELELTERAAEVKRQERKSAMRSRRPLSSTITVSQRTNDIPSSSDVNRSAIEEQPQIEPELLQEMVDTYVDLSGGYLENDIAAHTVHDGDPLPAGKKGVEDAPTEFPTKPQSSEGDELPSSESILPNTDSQRQTQEYDIGKSQQLEIAINLLHEKSEEIESLRSQLSEQCARYNSVQSELDRLNTEHETLVVRKRVQARALVEAKESIKSLETHIDTLEHRQIAWDGEKKQEQTDEINAWAKERERLTHEKRELEKRQAELESVILIRAQTDSNSDLLQRQSEWESAKESWSVERSEWLQKELVWQEEKGDLQERIKSTEQEKEKFEMTARSAEKDTELFRSQYSAASSFADSVRAENTELQQRNDALQKEATIAHRQAKDGVQAVKEMYQLRVKALEEELEKLKSLCGMLKTKDERTNDEVRRLAALYPELVDENNKLRHEISVFEDIFKNSRVKALTVQSSSDSLEYEDDAIFQDSLLQSGPDTAGDDHDCGYMCEWEWCNAVFKELKELTDHVTSNHIVV